MLPNVLLKDQLRSIAQSKRKVLVVGLGISGIETCKFFSRIGISAVCVERTNQERFNKTSKFSLQVAELQSAGVQVHFGVDGEAVARYLDGVDLAVLSPGVSLESSIVSALKRRNLPYLSELELGTEILGLPVVAITGSNGKSTTVTLCYELLKAAGYNALLCGNVGIPVVSKLQYEDVFSAAAVQPSSANQQSSAERKVLVIEASSYQLESCKRLKPRVAALLNISDNHLERHGTLQRYLEAKARVFANQDSKDWAILNAEDSAVLGLSSRLKSQIATFGEKEKVSSTFSATVQYQPTNDIDRIIIKSSSQSEVFNCCGMRLLGLHNRMNIAVALLVAKVFECDFNSIQQALLSFKPLEHRLEMLGKLINGADIINDSKSTTVAAAIAAISAVVEAFPDRPLYVMLGGQAKAGSWDPLMQLLVSIKANLKAVICFGGDASLVASHCLRYSLPHEKAAGLRKATQFVTERLMPQDILLLTPACASFDEFLDFEDRGAVFKSTIAQISNSKSK